ncbi:15344_t:CDS:2 [Cetraspora pellucida]|uniref:15344_t:CDS:1 n=1 Tax=Cetraspora pellucida TaxID=1433469 RepID=A0A9N9NEF2_9GLOM|nr:15344_t:CDS:2 [Cetraspora pellucida]
MATGTISLRKPCAEGHCIFRNKKDGVTIVMEKWKDSLLRVIFLQDDKIIHAPSEYKYEYNLGDKVDTYRKTSDIEGIICWIFV